MHRLYTCREGNTALHLACQSNQLKVIEVLLQWGARANMTNASGFAPVSIVSTANIHCAHNRKLPICVNVQYTLVTNLTQANLWLAALESVCFHLYSGSVDPSLQFSCCSHLLKTPLSIIKVRRTFFASIVRHPPATPRCHAEDRMLMLFANLAWLTFNSQTTCVWCR